MDTRTVSESPRRGSGSTTRLSPLSTTQHARSLSASPKPPPPPKSMARTGSVPSLSGLGTAPPPSVGPRSKLRMQTDLSTIRDPRSPDDFPSPHGSAASSPHPDLNSEVATLSNKLISAINHQTNLDDALSAARQELEASQEKVRELELKARQHSLLVASGALVRKSDFEDQTNKLVAKLAEERNRRITAEREKKTVDQELENLTAALFEEANEMVATARKDREAAEKRTEYVKTQLKDTELLLASHQEQLADLKSVIQKMNADREAVELTAAKSDSLTTPEPSAALSQKLFSNLQAESASVVENGTPEPPLSFTELLAPVLRTNLQMYEDFHSLVQVARQSAPPSRVGSGSYSGISTPDPSASTSRDTQAHLPSNGSNATLSTPGAAGAGTAGAPSPTPSTSPSSNSIASTIPLKETRFYKRAVSEDIEPTLRLDTAPGLSWLARRSVITNMCEGSLVVEPMPQSSKVQILPCALCGENRREEQFSRTHRFRTSESDTAQRYPLCGYCLNRVRATCDYLGFLRMVKDGHWRTDGAEAEKLAWEESVRLRERMFWARIGGGVVPVNGRRETPRPSIDISKPLASNSAPEEVQLSPRTRAPSFPQVTKKENGTSLKPASKHSPGRPIITRQDSDSDSDGAWDVHQKAPIFDDGPPPETTPSAKSSATKKSEPPKMQLRNSIRESVMRRPRSRAESYGVDLTDSIRERSPMEEARPADHGLHITVPGSFDY